MKLNIQTAIQKRLPLIAGAILGLVAGYLYYRFVGCASGTCAITSNPMNSTLYGGVMGGLLGIVLTPEKRRSHSSENSESNPREE